MNEHVTEIFEEMKYYVPEVQIEGEHGLKWMLENDFISEDYLAGLLVVRRVQFLERRISPDMEIPVLEEVVEFEDTKDR